MCGVCVWVGVGVGGVCVCVCGCVQPGSDFFRLPECLNEYLRSTGKGDNVYESIYLLLIV